MQSNENSWMFTNFEPHEFKEIPSVQYKHTFELFIEKSYGNFLYIIFWKIFEIFFETLKVLSDNIFYKNTGWNH